MTRCRAPTHRSLASTRHGRWAARTERERRVPVHGRAEWRLDDFIDHSGRGPLWQWHSSSLRARTPHRPGASETSRSIPFTQAPCPRMACPSTHTGATAPPSAEPTRTSASTARASRHPQAGDSAHPRSPRRWLPVPRLRYVPSGSPAGIDGAGLGAFGYALSSAQASGWIAAGRRRGRYTADQFGAAIKLVYDHLTWGPRIPPRDTSTPRRSTICGL